jgi:NitT/TauT family transport system substrate-binding protein
VNEHPDEAAQIQVDKNYLAGDPAFNASVLKSYNYLPSVQGGYDAIKLSVQQLTDIGILKAGTDAAEFADNSYLFFADGQVPDT